MNQILQLSKAQTHRTSKVLVYSAQTRARSRIYSSVPVRCSGNFFCRTVDFFYTKTTTTNHLTRYKLKKDLIQSEKTTYSVKSLVARGPKGQELRIANAFPKYRK